MVNKSSFSPLIKGIEWKNVAERDKYLNVAHKFESDLVNNLLLNYTELSKKYPEIQIEDWFNFQANKKISIHLTRIGATFDDAGGRKLKNQIENLMAKINNTSTIDIDSVKAINNMLTYYKSSVVDKKIKEMQKLYKDEGLNHTFIFSNEEDPDNSFEIINSTSENDTYEPDTKIGHILEVYSNKTEEFLGFVFVNPQNLPSILRNKITVFSGDVFQRYFSNYKKTFTKHTLKPHKIVLPLKSIKTGTELYVK